MRCSQPWAAQDLIRARPDWGSSRSVRSRSRRTTSSVSGRATRVSSRSDAWFGESHPEGITVYVPLISRDRVEDARNVLKEGDEVNAMIVNIDRKTRSIQLSAYLSGKKNYVNPHSILPVKAASAGTGAALTGIHIT